MPVTPYKNVFSKSNLLVYNEWVKSLEDPQQNLLPSDASLPPSSFPSDIIF